MADKKPKQPAMWLGHPIVEPADAHDLEQRAAEFEFGQGMGRKDAEEQALHHYRLDRHRRAAAHHLNGMKMANAAGNQEAAKQHHAMYTAHMEAAGHDPMGAVPPEVKHYEPKPERIYGHQPHPVDAFLQSKGTGQHEPEK